MRFGCSRDMDISGEKTTCQFSRGESSSVSLNLLCRIMRVTLVQMSDSATVVTYLKLQGGMVSLDMCRLAQEIIAWSVAVHGQHPSKIHSWEEHHSHRPVKLSHRMVPSSLGVLRHLQGVWSCSHRSVHNKGKLGTSSGLNMQPTLLKAVVTSDISLKIYCKAIRTARVVLYKFY